MQGKQIIKGAVVLGVVFALTAGTQAHTNQDHLAPDDMAPVPDSPDGPPHAKAPMPLGPPREMPRPPISFPYPGDPFTPDNVRSDHIGTLFSGTMVLAGNGGQDGALAPEFDPLPARSLNVVLDGVIDLSPSSLFTGGRQALEAGGSSGFVVPSAVPAPGAIALLGLAALAGRRRRRHGLV